MTKPNSELVRDLSAWATEREAQHRIQDHVFTPQYEDAVRNHLKKGDRSAAAKIIREIILENTTRARNKQNAQGHVGYVRRELERYGFTAPGKNETGDLELWVPLAKSLKKGETYWQKLLAQIEGTSSPKK